MDDLAVLAGGMGDAANDILALLEALGRHDDDGGTEGTATVARG